MRKKSKVKRVLWGRPKLIVVVRGKPGEGALVACKAAVTPVGAGTDFNGCDFSGDVECCSCMCATVSNS